jgi:CheY-like chemotaxis protein
MPHTILVLEDDMPLQNAIKVKLQQDDFVVISVQNVKQALDYLTNTGKVDIIWVDHYLYGAETGLDFMSVLKKDIRWKDIPAIVVSNTASPDKVEAYKALGIKRYFVKSDFRLDKIISDINRLIKKA